MVNLTKNDEQLTSEIMNKIDLTKDKLNLENHVVNLSKTVVNLSKQNSIDFYNKKARVIVVLDYSGSMRKLYNNGTVQDTLTRLVPIGLTFDDNGAIETYIFRHDSVKLADMTINNYNNYVENFINNKVGKYGRTVYSAALGDINESIRKKNRLVRLIRFIMKLFRKKYTRDDDITFVMFITDGNNEDGDNKICDEMIRQLSYNNVFIQFIGIGESYFRYFDRIPKIKNRKSNNAKYTLIKNLNTISDTELYGMILEEFASWIKKQEENNND